MSYFNNVKSYDDLKKQYRDLIKKYHPDNNGNEEIMKAVNIEYEKLFPIWKLKQETETGKTVNETAESTKRTFYTQYGWEGSNYDVKLTTKDIAKKVREYVKEKYSNYKFSIRKDWNEIYIALKTAPKDIYKTIDQLTWEEKNDLVNYAIRYNYNSEDDPVEDCVKNVIEELKKCNIKSKYDSIGLKILKDEVKNMVKDIDRVVQSYNYDDSDAMIDYFDTNFYYYGVSICEVEIVPKQEKKKSTRSKNTNVTTIKDGNIKQGKYTYTVKPDKDTRDNSDIWIVKITEKLDKEEYIKENKAMKERGGYYSRFKHGFLFKFDPSDILDIAS